jgi:hypothetical protein
VARDVLVDSPDGDDALRRGRNGRLQGPARPAAPDGGSSLKRLAGLLLLGLPAGLAIAFPVPEKPARPTPIPFSEKSAPFKPLDASPALDAALARIASELVAEFSAKGLTDEGLSIAVIDMSQDTPNGTFPAGSYRGDVSYYPCSVVKLCFLSFYESRKQEGKLADTPELVRAVQDMIRVSSNDATGFVVDSLTGTTSGPELSGAEWERWKARRNAVNDWYRARGYTNLNANQKTFCEDAYGREQAFRDGGKNRNRMTAAEAARILKEIAHGEVAGEALTVEMLMLLSRDIAADEPFEDLELEDARLAGQGLPRGSRIWAKSGDAYDLHHLVARVALPNGSDYVIAVFTKGVKDVPDVIPRAYEKVAAHFLAPAPRP